MRLTHLNQLLSMEERDENLLEVMVELQVMLTMLTVNMNTKIDSFYINISTFLLCSRVYLL